MSTTRLGRWFSSRWLSISTFLVAVLALVVTLVIGRSELASWSGFDLLRPSADESKIRVLVASLSGDLSGQYTADLENALRSAQKRFRKLGRHWSPSEDERLDQELERQSISDLLRRHESDAFVHGYVGTDSATVWLVPRDRAQDVRRYTISSGRGFSSLIDDLEPILVQGIQSRVDAAKFSIGRDRHTLIDLQIGDLLEQTTSAETRRQLLFQSAFTKEKLAFWRREPGLADESVAIYEALLAEVPNDGEESMLRINIGLNYQLNGMEHADTEAFATSLEHFARAEEIFEKRTDVRRWAKARNLSSASEIRLHSLTGDLAYLVSAAKRQRETIEDAIGWLSDVDVLLVFQEGVGSELLLAYAKGDTYRLRHYFELMVENMDAWRLRADKEGVGSSPWVRALINCTALQLIDPMDLEAALLREPEHSAEAELGSGIVWSNVEIGARRTLVESWLPAAKNGPFAETFELQLSHLADLVREEALRTHDVVKLERSFQLTMKFRELADVESATIRYGELDLALPMAEVVLGFEGTLALACADRDGIEHVLKLLARSAAACEEDPAVCSKDVSWIEYWQYWLEYGLERWKPNRGAVTPPPERAGPDEAWELGRYHALWLRHELAQLPSLAESFCPSRVRWVE